MGRGSRLPLDAQDRWTHGKRLLHGGEDRPRLRAGVITLIHGGERYLVDRAARDLLQPLRATLTLEFNYEDIQADALTADAFAEKAGTLPFIDALRVLVVRDWGLLAGKRDKGAGAERAAAYLEGTPDSTHLVLVAHALVAPGNPIYRVVAAMESDSREEEIFALTDSLAGSRPGEVAGVLQSLLDDGREPTWLLYTLVSHWRRLLQARAVRDRGGSLADLQARSTDHPFVVEKAFRQAADYRAADLDRGFHDLLRIEEQIKLGELDARLAVEGFILEQVLSAG